jgi:hypothetical protein
MILVVIRDPVNNGLEERIDFVIVEKRKQLVVDQVFI